MRAILISCLTSSLAICATPSMADQYHPDAPYADQHRSWDADGFWRGAGDDIGSRINFMQSRINGAVSDGSLNGYQARRLNRALASIRRDAWHARGQNLQWRLDNLGAQIHWQRDGGGDMGYRGGDHDRYVTTYDAARDYRDDQRYQERPLSANDPVYRGSDGRVYCKRGDGTTGLVVGAVGGAAVGNAISDRHDRTAGTLIGGALGALVGQQIDSNANVRCR